MTYSIFEQFEIVRLIPLHLFGNFDISFTNSGLFMIIAAGFFYFLYKAVIENGFIVPGR